MIQTPSPWRHRWSMRIGRPVAAASLFLTSGCSLLQTRPGNPDSYGTSVFGGDYYANSRLKDLEWRTPKQSAVDADTAVADLQSKGVPIYKPPPKYRATTIPHEIWEARGAAWNLHLKYLAASYKAGEVQDVIAVPMFGAAVATGALGIARAGTVALAAAGLGGGAIYGAYNYLQPNKDLSTDQTAAFGLLCLVNASLPLRTMSVVPLILDKAALQDALDQLAIDPPPHKVATAAQDAAAQTLASLDTNIKLYNDMPALIYAMIGQIDKTAQTGGTRTLNYGDILSALQSSSANKTANASAQTTVNTAKNAAPIAQGTKSSASNKHLKSVTSVDSDGDPSTALSEAPQPATADADTSVAGTSDADNSDPGSTGTNADTVRKLSEDLKATVTSQQRVTQIASDSLEDLAIREYPLITANLQACPSGQEVIPVPTTPDANSTPAAGTKTGT